MTMTDVAARKTEIREQAHAARHALPNKDELSRVIVLRYRR